jgi:predicted ferric reductase
VCFFFSRDYFWATAALYSTAWLARVLRTIYSSRSGLPATITRTAPTLLAVHIPIPTRGRFAWAPGQHVFVRFRGLGGLHALTAHPFTLASVQADGVADLVLRVHGGITRALASAVDANGGEWTTRVAVDGPYGYAGLHVALGGYDRVCLLAGGSG